MAVGVQPIASPARGALDPYVPRVLLAHLAQAPEATVRVVDGSVVMADISGFTALSERLARLGREGAEQVADAIGDSFASLLAVAYDHGGSLLKFGGDALLLLFEGDDHAARACRSAVGMRRRLREAGRVRTPGGRVVLRMSQGVHSGAFHLFLVGGSHRELLVTGPAVTTAVAMEKIAEAGEVVVSAATAVAVGAAYTGASKGPGVLLTAAPPAPYSPVALPEHLPPPEAVAACLSTEVRRHVLDGRRTPPEHRTATVAFVRFGGSDALLADHGPTAPAAALDRVVRVVQDAADARHVSFLGSDVDSDGGKLMLAAGAPRSVGDDEERMLLTVRAILDADLPLAVRAGVHRGSVFCGDVGPEYRRTYTTMGDTTNLAARLMAAAPWGACYTTPAVLDRSATAFTATPLAPLRVKGKADTVAALRLGRPGAARSRDHIADRFPLVGREGELRALRAALADATGRRRAGRAVQIGGEPGIGKTRLVEELCENAGDVLRLSVACEAYAAAVPYAPWHVLLRAALGHERDAPAEAVAGDLEAAVRAHAPDLHPWLPLLGIPLGLDLAPTPQVGELGPEVRAARLHEVIRRFLGALLPRPALITVEAAHQMDRASADLLRAVVDDLAGVPWLVLVTRREVEGGFRLPEEGGHLHLEAGPLSGEDALLLAETVTEHAPLPPHVVRLAAARSAGNPQFLRDLLRAADADPEAPLPDSIETAAMARLDRLPRADAALVRRVAVLGESFDENLLPVVLDDEVPTPDEATWQRLWRYFDRDGGRVRFRRSVARMVAYESLSFRTRRRLHAAVAERIQRDAGVDVDEQAAILSLHLHRAGREDAAWRFARIAGDRAREQYAYADAATLYRRAIECARRMDAPAVELVGAWEALADALARTGQLAAADRALAAARRLLEDDPLREAQLLLRHAHVAERADRTVTAVRWTRRGLRALDGLQTRRARAVRARLTSMLATARLRQGHVEEAIELCRKAIDEARLAREREALAHACFILDWALVDAERAAEARYSGRALRIYERLGKLDRQAAVLNNLGGFAYYDGRWDDAVALYQRSAEASGRAGMVADVAFADLNMGEVLADQGRLAEAEQHLRRARQVWRGSDYAGPSATAAAFLGRALVRSGRHDEGLRLLQEAVSELRRLRVDGETALVQAYVAEAHVFRGEPELALALVDRLRCGAPRAAPLLHRVRGFALAQQGEPEAALAALHDAVLEAQRQCSDYELALSLDALLAVAGPAVGESAAWRRRRDALVQRLRVVALPQPPVAGKPVSPAAVR